jgi:hypothetical protein
MKKIVLSSLLSVAALGAYAQGELVFTDYHFPTLSTEIYSPTTTSPHVTLNGNITTDTPKGTLTAAQMYPGSVPIGGSAVNGSGANGFYANGNNFKVQLEALGNGASGSAGVAPAISSLLPVTQYTTSPVTSTAVLDAGQFQPPAVANDTGIANSAGGAAWVAVAAWYNAGGTGDATLAAAKADANGIWGESAEVFQSNLYEPVSGVAPAPGQVPYMTTDTFSLQTNLSPEPSSIALGVMAAGAFLARRRKS